MAETDKFRAYIKIRTGQNQALSAIVDRDMAPWNIKAEALVDGKWELI